MPPAGALFEQPTPRPAAAEERDALCPLLDAYRGALKQASARQSLPAIGTRRFVVEHVRRGTAALQREYCWRIADAGEDQHAEASRRRLESFEASLPVPPSPLQPLVLAIVVVVVAQVLGPLGAGIPSSDKLADEVAAVQSFDVTQLGAAVDALTHATVQAVLFVVWAYALAAALVLWPIARGYRAARAILGLGAGAAGGSVVSAERLAFARFDAQPPRERGFDLWSRACGLTALAAIAAMFLWYVVTMDEGSERVVDLAVAALLAAPVVWGGIRIRRELRRRRDDANR